VLEMKWRRTGRGVGKFWASCLVLALVATLILPATAYAAQPQASSGVTGIQIVKKCFFNNWGQRGKQLPSFFRPQQFATITGKLGALSPGQKSYAIAIGSNYLDSVAADGQIPLVPGVFPLQLEYAEADAQEMARLLTAYGFDEVISLVGNNASRDNILNAIERVGRLAKPGDEVVFFYSGHGARYSGATVGSRGDMGRGVSGVTHEGIVTDEGDGNKVDFIWDQQLAKEFSDFRTDRIVFIFDSCLSGGMTELAGRGRIVCAATTSTGIAVEVGEFGDMVIDHGLFTFFLLAALSGSVPEADAYDHVPGVPDVTVEEAYNFASFQLVELSPIIQDALGDLAALWATPVVVDLFPTDMLLQALPTEVTERARELPPFRAKGYSAGYSRE
jgi:hypothetical protein